MGCICFTIPSLPQVENGFSGTGPGGKEGDISVNVQPLRQHPPVVAEGDGGVQHPAERLLGLTGEGEGEEAAVGLVTGAATGARPHLELSVSAARAGTA